MPFSRGFSKYPSGCPTMAPSLQVPFTELPHRETQPPEALSTISQSPRKISPLHVAQLSPHKKRFPSQEPSFRNFQGPQQNSPPPCRFPKRTPIERDAPFSEPPFNCLSQFPVNGHVRPLSPPSTFYVLSHFNEDKICVSQNIYAVHIKAHCCLY